MYLKNKKTGHIAKYSRPQGENYVECTQEEIDGVNLQKQKKNLIGQRRQYLKQTFEIWFDDVENITQDVKDKRILAKQEIEAIETATVETINNFSNNF